MQRLHGSHAAVDLVHAATQHTYRMTDKYRCKEAAMSDRSRSLLRRAFDSIIEARARQAQILVDRYAARQERHARSHRG
jgi:hypothetical protein